ncbi:ABC transporter permease [Aminobacter aminovorans]|uniref:ABC transporter permease n=1 Tax=Aminobacter aminovorans TaxID=83263 RepID=UPI0035E4034E
MPVLGPILFSQRLLTDFAFLLPVAVWIFLYRTKYGLEIRCVGENPKALDVKGLSVGWRQCLAIMFGSLISALAVLMLGCSDRFVPDLIARRGWLVVVAIIAGNWMPFRVVGAIFIFALLEAVAIHAQVVGVSIPHHFFLILPYAASLVLLAGLRSRTHQPEALGVPYSRKRSRVRLREAWPDFCLSSARPGILCEGLRRAGVAIRGASGFPNHFTSGCRPAD